MEVEKVFNDCVHGPIRLHPLCVKIIDTPAFQRLRNIKQLGTTYLVYPGGSHNRFEHSLGVCYLAGRMVEALRANSNSIYSHLRKYDDKRNENGDSEDDRTGNDQLIDISNKEQLCVEIAGLCHDVGHGPFSHLWEQVLADCGVQWKHEQSSKDMFDYLIKENNLIDDFEENGLGERERNLIKELISGEGTTLEPKKQFLYQIVSNKDNDIDVDKWDYFLRDGHQLNLKITFDYHRMLEFCCVVEDETGRRVIGFRNKESNNLWDMFRVRADLHHRAYQHRVVKNFDVMYIDAFVEANKVYQFEADGEIVKLSEAHKNLKAFSYLTDHIMYSIFCDRTEALQKSRTIINRIHKRQMYTHIGTYTIEIDEERLLNLREVKELLSDLIKGVTQEVVRFSINKADDKRHIDSFRKIVVFEKCKSIVDWPKYRLLKGERIDPASVSGPFVMPKEIPRLVTYVVYVFCEKHILDEESKKEIDHEMYGIIPKAFGDESKTVSKR